MTPASKMFVALMAGLMFILQGCGNKSRDIPEIAKDNKLTTLVKALSAAGLDDTLEGKGPFTVFAPTDKAFSGLPAGLFDALLLPANKDKLVQVLEYHVASGKVLSTDLKNNEKIMTLEKQNATVTIDNKTVTITGGTATNIATVTTADVTASNGVVHVIDTVLVPPDFTPPVHQNIPEIATANKLATLVKALSAAGLVDTLEGKGPFTVFAPTDQAFSKLPAGLLDKLLLKANKAKLVQVLEYHVASGKVLSTDLKNNEKIMTLEKQNATVTIDDKTVTITGGTATNTATVTAADVMATNGVVHVIDAVLVPSDFVPPTEENAIQI